MPALGFLSAFCKCLIPKNWWGSGFFPTFLPPTPHDFSGSDVEVFVRDHIVSFFCFYELQ